MSAQRMRDAPRIAMLLNVRPEQLWPIAQCKCGCGMNTLGVFVRGHNAERAAIVNAVRRAGWQHEERACKGCGRRMRRSEMPLLSDGKWDERRTCGRQCANRAWREGRLGNT